MRPRQNRIPISWRAASPTVRLLALVSWAVGVVVLAAGWLGDREGFWSDRPFLTNVASSLATAALGLPIALVVIQQLVAGEESYRQEWLASEELIEAVREAREYAEALTATAPAAGPAVQGMHDVNLQHVILGAQMLPFVPDHATALAGQLQLLAATWPLYSVVLGHLPATVSGLRDAWATAGTALTALPAARRPGLADQMLTETHELVDRTAAAFDQLTLGDLDMAFLHGLVRELTRDRPIQKSRVLRDVQKLAQLGPPLASAQSAAAELAERLRGIEALIRR
ncbi:hypothetical protein [Micromonospora sp. NPDC005979]|uniref:hypothetical protein n=1 Tax=Micromonospora sp. NPDC005979 TaxID=3156726 RepID=UPI0033AFADC5